MTTDTGTSKCPRCYGTGCFEFTARDGNGFSDLCRACHSTGRMTKELWREWCDWLEHLNCVRVEVEAEACAQCGLDADTLLWVSICEPGEEPHNVWLHRKCETAF